VEEAGDQPYIAVAGNADNSACLWNKQRLIPSMTSVYIYTLHMGERSCVREHMQASHQFLDSDG
jgi:hypothetical protein